MSKKVKTTPEAKVNLPPTFTYEQLYLISTKHPRLRLLLKSWKTSMYFDVTEQFLSCPISIVTPQDMHNFTWFPKTAELRLTFKDRATASFSVFWVKKARL